MTRLELKEGNVGECWKCGKQIFAKMTKGTEKYPSKLQWQEAIEGKNPPEYQSHYQYDFKTKETSCRGEKTGELKTADVKEQTHFGVGEQYKVKELDMNDLAVKAHLRHFEADMTDFEMYETFIFNRYGNINPAKAGMIIKFLEERRKERLKE